MYTDEHTHWVGGLHGQQGFQRGQFVVARVEPDLPPAEITENWFPAATQEA